MFESLLKSIFGSKHDRDVTRVGPIVDEINAACESCRDLSDEELRGRTAEFRARIAAALEGLTDPAERREAEQAVLEEILPEAYGVVKEACRRLVGRSWEVVGIPVTWDMVPYDVQLIGGIVLHQGKIAEMATGEGKTLVATHAAVPQRPHRAAAPTWSRSTTTWPAATASGWGRSTSSSASPWAASSTSMDPTERREQYACDITYGTNNEFGFDYLRDNMAVRPGAPGAARLSSTPSWTRWTRS